jgi:hypothetical protein
METTHVQVLVTGAFQCGAGAGAKLVRGGDGTGAKSCRCGTCACVSFVPGDAVGTSTRRCKLCVAVRDPPMKSGLRQVGQEYVSANP